MAVNLGEAGSDTSLPIPSRRSPLVDRGRFVSDAWWPFFQGLFTTLRNSVGAVQETIDQLAGVWTLSVNTNNRVAGQVKLDGSAELSAFSVLADKFIVVHPSVDGTTITAFVVGLVNGISTVGINGNLVVDDTILARHIDVSTLSAIAANIGEVTAGVVRSSDSKMIIDLTNKTLTITT
jgi:hypothetical protein